MSTEIIEGNKLIAEFDGRKFKAYKYNSSYVTEFDTYDECEEWIKVNNFEGYFPEIGWKMGCGKYNSSWDWLHPAWEKFRDLEMQDEWYKTHIKSISYAISYYTITVTFNRLVRAIKWYQNQTINNTIN